MADDHDEELGRLLAYSSFIQVQPGAVLIDLATLDRAERFQAFVEGLFLGDFRFQQLNYAVFSRILYEFDKVERIRQLAEQSGRVPPPLRLAHSIVPFPAHRQRLYQNLKQVGKRVEEKRAEFLFDTPFERYEEDGMLHERETRRDVDEFIAALWAQGVRAGLDVVSINRLISEGGQARETVAEPIPPRLGRDATYEEVSELLHRDVSPVSGMAGRVNFKRYKNTFPQVKAGVRLLRKVPLQHGFPGRAINGEPIAPPEPADFDLASLAGEGAMIREEQGEQYLLSAMEGFIGVDNQSGRISITRQIINHEGIGSRTGDIDVVADAFETHGDVVENYVLEGKSIDVHGDVYGTVISKGGLIRLKGNVSGGTAENHDGDIEVHEGLVSRATLIARQGAIYCGRVENSLLVADYIDVHECKNSTLIGNRIRIAGTSLGTSLLARQLDIHAVAEPRGGRETVIALIVPDERAYRHRVARLERSLDEVLERLDVRKQERSLMAADESLVAMEAIAQRLKAEGRKPEAAELAAYREHARAAAPIKTRLQAIETEVVTLQDRSAELAQALEQEQSDFLRELNAVSCDVDEVSGLVVLKACTPPLVNASLPLNELDILRKLATTSTASGDCRLVSSGANPISWRPSLGAE